MLLSPSPSYGEDHKRSLFLDIEISNLTSIEIPNPNLHVNQLKTVNTSAICDCQTIPLLQIR